MTSHPTSPSLTTPFTFCSSSFFNRLCILSYFTHRSHTRQKHTLPSLPPYKHTYIQAGSNNTHNHGCWFAVVAINTTSFLLIRSRYFSFSLSLHLNHRRLLPPPTPNLAILLFFFPTSLLPVPLPILPPPVLTSISEPL